MANWIDFSQYEGFAILDDASKIRTSDGMEHNLTPGKLFYFINPNTGVKNFAKPDVLLARAMKTSKPKEEKAAPKKEKKAQKEPSAPVVPYRQEKIKSMRLTGRQAVVEAIATNCDLYYNTPRWGWIASKHDPSYILSRLDSPNEDLVAEWPANSWGIK